MGLFRSRKQRATGKPAERKTTAGRPTRPEPGPEPRKRRARDPDAFRRFLRYAGLLLAGIAVMAGVGYLVVAIWLFPSPLMPSERVMPRVIGLSENEADRQLGRLGFTVTTAREPHLTAGAGLVTWQDPPPGVAVTTDTRVSVTVSGGMPYARVPDVTGMDLPMAERLLAAVGLRVDAVDTVTIKTQHPGVAAGTTPARGDSLPMGRGVTVHLAN